MREQIAGLEAILADPALLNTVIKDEISEIRETFATDRVCRIGYDDGEMSIEDLVDDKELVVVMTEAQYIKAVPAGSFKTQGRGGRGVSGGRLKADDIVRHVIFTTAHAHLLFFSNRGKVYRLRALDLPERERTAKGMPIVNLLPLQNDERIQAIIDTRDFAGERFLFFATKNGTVKKTAFDALRLQPPRRSHRHQPEGRRRTRAGHRDLRRRRHLHGQPWWPDDPVRRERCPGHGAHRRRRARHEAEERRRPGRLGRCGS